MKRCSRPSPLSSLSPLGTKDTVSSASSSEETKNENVRTLKQASSEKSVFSELRKKEGKKIRCDIYYHICNQPRNNRRQCHGSIKTYD